MDWPGIDLQILNPSRILYMCSWTYDNDRKMAAEAHTSFCHLLPWDFRS
jgi:hypothetical protein